MSLHHTRLVLAGLVLMSSVLTLAPATWGQTPKVDTDQVELRGNDGPGGDDRGRDGDDDKDKKNKKCPSKPCPDRDRDDDKDDD